jgi:hypothetical protein
MTKQATIRICSDKLQVEVVTERNITTEMIERVEKHIDAVINDNLTHDLSGRITSINMSLHMLEQVITPDATRRYKMLKKQFEDLSRLIEKMT